MKYAYLLEMSIKEPRQYRITVIGELSKHLHEHSIEGHTFLGYFVSEAELMAVLTPYLNMESSK